MIAFGRYFPAGFWIEYNVVVFDVTQPVVDAFLDAVGGFGGLESGVFLVFAATAPKDEPGVWGAMEPKTNVSTN